MNNYLMSFLNLVFMSKTLSLEIMKVVSFPYFYKENVTTKKTIT